MMILLRKKIKGLLSKIRRVISKSYKFFVIKKTMEKKSDQPYKIGFIVQLPSIWDKQIDIYEEMLKRDNLQIYLFVVPEYDFKDDKVLRTYDNNYFLGKYQNAIKLLDDRGKWLDLKEYRLDYMFYPRPYDHYLPRQYRSDIVSKYCKCCYIPYGLTGADVFDDSDLPFYDNMHCLFMDSNYKLKSIKSRYPVSYALGIKKMFSLGYPVLARFLDYPKTDGIKTITWTPRWSLDPLKGGSNFLKYCNDFLSLIKNDKYRFIFRPHPLMFDELIKKGYVDDEFKKKFLGILSEHKVLFDTVSPIEEIFRKTDLLITDFSSIIPQFFMTNRPIIYCESGINLNEDYLEMMKYSYVAKSWEDVLKYIGQIKENEDLYAEKRLKFIEEKYSICRNSAALIVNELEKGI